MPPQIIQFPEDRKVRAGESVELLGKVTGTQPITCTWMKFRKQVSGGGVRPESSPHSRWAGRDVKRAAGDSIALPLGGRGAGEPLPLITRPPNLSS